LGYRAEYTENSKATHNIPLDLALFNGNYQQIVEEMSEFLRDLPDCREFPPLYCLPMYKSQNLLVLAWLLSRVQDDLAVEIRPKVYSLPVLFYELARDKNKSTKTSLAMPSLSGCDTPGLSCSWHKDVETSQCTTTMVSRWSYMMFSLCCPLYGLEHCPVEEMTSSMAGSITSTMSICLGDTGFSREMGRDVTRFGDQELSTDIRRASGWPRYPGQGLHGGGNKMEEENGDMTKSSSVSRKRQVPGKVETPSKKSKLLREYKQDKTSKKSPMKTPTKRKTPRLRCKNVFC
jgi:hypothetical protein